jgi:hypothetical protein
VGIRIRNSVNLFIIRYLCFDEEFLNKNLWKINIFVCIHTMSFQEQLIFSQKLLNCIKKAMQIKAENVDEYVNQLPEDRQVVIEKLRKSIKENLAKGFEEETSYGMIGYVVPHSIYPSGYHCTPKLPLPFMNVASQKNFVAVYYMGFADKTILEWFTNEFPKHSKIKLDMGVGCIRFKKIDQIPYELIGQLASKMTVDDWITVYEKTYKNKG